MSEAVNDGGPAFPTWEEWRGFSKERGMSLRDYLAAAALQGLIAQSMGTAISSDCEIGAAYCYRFADAMLHARSQPKAEASDA